METIKLSKKAPIGYIAVENQPYSYGCESCAFNFSNDIRCYLEDMTEFKSGDCSEQYREDSKNVHFISDKKEIK